MLSYPKDKIRILLLEGIHRSAQELLKHHGYASVELLASSPEENELAKKIKDVHLLGIRSKTQVNRQLLEQAGKLMAVGAFCIGTNQIDLKDCTERGIAVFNSPFSNTRSVAELVIAEIILLLRKVIDKNRDLHRGIWNKSSKGSYEARGKMLGIIGYGHIGSQVSVLADAMGMHVNYYDIEPKLPLGNARAVNSLEELLMMSDMVTLHVPGLASTKKMIGSDQIRMMKKGTILINCARGDLVVEQDVRHALMEGHLGGYGTDVFSKEPASNEESFESLFQNLPNTFITPHIGGSTLEAQENIGLDVAMKLVNYLDTGSTAGSLSIPDLYLPVMKNTHRLLHIHHNRPGVLSDINNILSGYNANILGQYLKTNEAIGYVVTDVDKKTSAKISEAIREVKHTIRVRTLY